MTKRKNTSPHVAEQGVLLDSVNAFLQQAKHAQDADSFADLMYGLERLGRTLYKDKDKEMSAHHFKLAVENLKKLARTHQNKEQELTLVLSSGQTYLLLGLWTEARTCFEQAIRLSSELGDQKKQARIVRQLANLELKSGRIAEALHLLQQSLSLSRDNGELAEQAAALNSMAACYFQMAEWKKMERVCGQALSIAEDLQLKSLMASINNNLGAMYSLRGKWDEALLAFHKSLSLFELLGDDRGLAETSNNLATLYRDKEMWPQAGEYYARSLALAGKIGDADVKASATLNRVELYVLMHDLELAEYHCKIALNAFHELGKETGVADACRLLGVIHTMRENWRLATRYFKEALQLGEKYGSNLVLAETHRDYGDMLRRQQQKSAAADSLKQSLKFYQALKATKEAQKLKRQIKALSKA